MHGRVNLWPKNMLCGYLKYEATTSLPELFGNLSWEPRKSLHHGIANNVEFFLTEKFLLIRNRRSREESILKAIENGAETLFDIVANVYSGVDRSLWTAAASNVRLHVDHLDQQKKLPKGFSMENFIGSLVAFESLVEFSVQRFHKTWVPFFLRWTCAYVSSRIQFKCPKLKISSLLITGTVIGIAGYSLGKKACFHLSKTEKGA
ncbi:hypothetical protein Gotri_015133 [Gossypium trilobum]|uniref:LACTB2 winged helix domain-containing protein n=1 Tax=Gossypium trilobum TaxID=34281 RepID=A0A7J9DZ40_9ROSI|nr:hypothetical protein [Gossypium trilobum]